MSYLQNIIDQLLNNIWTFKKNYDYFLSASVFNLGSAFKSDFKHFFRNLKIATRLLTCTRTALDVVEEAKVLEIGSLAIMIFNY